MKAELKAELKADLESARKFLAEELEKRTEEQIKAHALHIYNTLDDKYGLSGSGFSSLVNNLIKPKEIIFRKALSKALGIIIT